MKSRPEDLRPPRFLSSRSRLQPPPTQTLSALKTQTLEGNFTLDLDRKRNMQNHVAGRRSAVIIPCVPLPAPPPSSTINPTPPLVNTPDTRHPNSEPASPASPRPAPEEEEEEEEEEEREKPPQPARMSITESDLKLEFEPAEFEPAGPDPSSPPASVVSHGSLSDFSRPPSSMFSRSTDLASGRSSIMSDFRDSDPEGSVCLSPLCPRSVMQSPSALTMRATTTSPLCERPSRPDEPDEPLSPRLTSGVLPQPDEPSAELTESHHRAASTDPAFNPCTDSNPGLTALAFPSATWSSCPSPQRTTPPRPDSRQKLTPSVSLTPLESHRWSVLPPISPVRGRCATAASRYSELSCSQSRVFDELEAIAPRSTSCPSLDQTDDSSCCSSPDTELSPGLAALTVGCDSGNLGSISRVQLLLLNRNDPDTAPSPFTHDDDLFEEEDWSDLRMEDDPELTSAGVSRPLTAGSDSERCDSAGKVQENKSDLSDGETGSPSSWIIDPSPSCHMFRSPPCSSAGENGPTGEECGSPGWRGSGSVDHSREEMERRMEERKTKALSMLSKLQDDTPRRTKNSRGCSNFEEFDFLAKYCIFSQEKLAEYKRAFEAEDSDGDGYISCLQVLLALKNILPAELLSEEEEIYVYRILEMVDFRVTDGLVDLRLFAVIASLAQKIATMDEFMRSLISDMDFRSLEVRLFKAKQLFLFLLEEQPGDGGSQPGIISAEQLLLELKAGGIRLEQEAAVRLELQRIPPLDLLDFLAYLPLFMIIHKSVISNPLDTSSNL
ncbi:pollen-specific leucine-rich repeat extensin-like protein 2 isoform X3 [Notolabrus celidotus]|uniref:pollen-specific leucine-rich repeat extensin-like protein 2 isoform X3 n=1 Tax=Notolabrus celidotus TaxID=1203425 RepID=UPI00148FF355|nr:pollen-specific leucine-rich repeat extensin-like protein 2 isoform X3 [Notolabrus celidotus]